MRFFKQTEPVAALLVLLGLLNVGSFHKPAVALEPDIAEEERTVTITVDAGCVFETIESTQYPGSIALPLSAEWNSLNNECGTAFLIFDGELHTTFHPHFIRPGDSWDLTKQCWVATGDTVKFCPGDDEGDDVTWFISDLNYSYESSFLVEVDPDS